MSLKTIRRSPDGVTLRATVDKTRLVNNVITSLRAMIAPAEAGGTLFGIQRSAADLSPDRPRWDALQSRQQFVSAKAGVVAQINQAVTQATSAVTEINSWVFHRGQTTLEHTLAGLYCIGQESARSNDGTAQGEMNGRCNGLATNVALFQFADERIKVSVEPVAFQGYENVQNYSAPRREQAARRGVARLRAEAQGAFRIETEVRPAFIKAEGFPSPPKTAMANATYQNWMSQCFSAMGAAAQGFRWSTDRKRFLLAATCSAPVTKERPAQPYAPNQAARVEGDVTYVWAVAE